MLGNWIGGQGTPIWLEPSGWRAAGAKAVFSFRLGGFSQGPFASLNAGGHVGDDAAAVAANRAKIAAHLSVPVHDIAMAEQVHGSRVALVGEDWPLLAPQQRVPFAASDALLTHVPGIALGILTADCVPVLFFDPVQRVVAAAHSGWRGTVEGISSRVVEAMVEVYGCRVQNVLAVLGPAIRRCCYEVDDTVADAFVARFGRAHVTKRPGRPGKFLLDLPSCIRKDLLQAGVSPHHLEDTGVCTACRNDVLFSYRADGGRTGRQLAVVGLSAKAEGRRLAL
ncbi:peptidoglycan editing factor PgeF [Alicyclobacillus shizuokensis]|uniref:peptidoglycan editing factor PgeF n=1 Tax=Alicyclobacillus shizuokensis TaxID=392014 RepID=UPI00082C8C5C|nr:peptidoglycan editing factor PgeF [Alicyclobacillus shizuokensis]MCL6627226.1 peptidoglycan editing factor PgeF [Alicyclobacillus shizuokensis]